MTEPRTAKQTKQPDRPKLIQVMGPGLITGASDDDPSGIATYSQVGAQFGYGLAWTLIFSYPLMTAIQEISARIGRVTGFGIAGNLRRHYPAWLSGGIVVLLLVANLINLGADLGAMGAALRLLIHGPAHLYVLLFGLLSAGVADFHPLRALYLHSEMAVLVAVQLCDLRFRGQSAVGDGGLGHPLASLHLQARISDGHRRRAGNHDQPLSFLLAGRTGSRR